MAHDTTVLIIAHSPAVYRGTRTWGWFGAPRYLYPRQAWAAIKDVFPWEALILTGAATVGLSAVVGSTEAAGLAVAVGLALVTTQMLRTRAFLTPRRLVRRSGLLFTRRVLDLPLSSIRSVRVVADPAIDEDFADVIVETDQQSYQFRAVTDATRVATAIRAHAAVAVGDRASLQGP